MFNTQYLNLADCAKFSTLTILGSNFIFFVYYKRYSIIISSSNARYKKIQSSKRFIVLFHPVYPSAIDMERFKIGFF